MKRKWARRIMEVEDLANQNAFTANTDTDVQLRDVLVLDYITETRLEACDSLARAGLNVSSADSLEAGLDALRRHEPDAVVVNIDAPGLDGHALCESINQAYPERSFSIFVVNRCPAEDGLEWTATIPKLRVLEAPVTAQKLAANSINH